MTRALATLCILVLTVTLGACNDSDHGTTYSDFREAFDAGKDCPALYEVRNDMDSSDPLASRVNDDLRSVGCFSSGSTRNDV